MSRPSSDSCRLLSAARGARQGAPRPFGTAWRKTKADILLRAEGCIRGWDERDAGQRLAERLARVTRRRGPAVGELHLFASQFAASVSGFQRVQPPRSQSRTQSAIWPMAGVRLRRRGPLLGANMCLSRSVLYRSAVRLASLIANPPCRYLSKVTRWVFIHEYARRLSCKDHVAVT